MARYSRPLFFPWMAPYDALWCPICIRIIEGVCLILPRVKSLLMNMCDDIALVLSVLFGKQTVYKALIFIDLPSSKPRCPMSLRARPLASICSIIYPSIDMWYTLYIYIYQILLAYVLFIFSSDIFHITFRYQSPLVFSKASMFRSCCLRISYRPDELKPGEILRSSPELEHLALLPLESASVPRTGAGEIRFLG